MENQFEYPEHIYRKKDLDKAFLMGLESAINILEKSIGLSPERLLYMLDSLKERIEQGKIFNFTSS